MESKRQLTAEEEAIKKNTDCIYFLASPLTCKKGNECEFRHCEVARVNPRDCWFWMNSNCLNPKCAFRHLPLDGYFEVPGAPSGQAGPYNNPSKQGIPCYYFQRGQCIKGDKCPFMHGSNPTTNDTSQQAANVPHQATNNGPQETAKVPTSFNTNSNTLSCGLKECSTMQQTTADQRGKILQSNSANKDVDFLRKSTSPYPLDNDLPRSQPISSDSTSSRPPLHYQSQLIEEHYSNGRETEDFLGESSPGFDVLVDGDEEEYVRESVYYHNEELGARNPTASQTVNNFDYHPDYDYEALASYERDECKRRLPNDYDRDHRRSMERVHKQRSAHKDSSHDENINGSDLRHSLLKKRRLNGRHGEPRYREPNHVEDRYRDRSSRRVSHDSRECSLSSRLQGRIKLPPNEFRDRERGRSRGRTSPTRTPNYKSRFQARIKHAPNDERRSHGARPNRRDDVNPVSFTGPKSLAELKGAKVSGSSQAIRSIIGQAHGDSLSFDGPKPLNDILKRKRESSGDESNENNAENLVDSTVQTAKDYDFDVENPKIKTDEEVKHSSMEDEELENFDPNDGDYEYEANEGEDFKAEDCDNVYQDDENAYLDDEEDEDEFARKVGGFFS